MTLNWIIAGLAVMPFIFAARIQLLDISPDEAQKLITQQNLDLRYAKKLSDGPARGRRYNGKIIDSEDYAEEIYEANQFHGQDGLGRYIFGHTDSNQARLEARNVNGEVRGNYQYKDPWNNDIQVQYWVDSLGFHQTDNRPKFELQPVTDTPEVQKAKEEHARLWNEAAKLNGIYSDSNESYNKNAEILESEHYTDDEQELEGHVSNQQQSLARYPVLSYSEHITPDTAREYGNVVDDSVVVEANEINEVTARAVRKESENLTEEVKSEPRGFFYSFDYPVQVIVDRIGSARAQPEAQAEASEIHYDVRYRDSEENLPETTFEYQTQHPRVSENIRDGLVPAEEIHDVQTHPNQKSAEQHRFNVHVKEDETDETQTERNMIQKVRVSENIRDGIVPQDEIHDTQVSPKQKVRGRGTIKFNSVKRA